MALWCPLHVVVVISIIPFYKKGLVTTFLYGNSWADDYGYHEV